MIPPLTQVPAHPKYGAQRTTPVVRGKRRGTITHMSGGAWVVTLDEPEDFSDPRGESCVSMSAGDSGSPADAGWCIDLEHATGRAHVASALAAYNMLRSPNGVLWWWDWRAWRLQCSKDSMGFSVVGSDNLCTKVSALSDLDPDDPTLLPDGSRWVDAEALARVLLHVLGGER